MFTADSAQHQVKGLKESFDNASRATVEMYMNLPAVNMYMSTEATEKYTSTEGLSGTKELGQYETPPTATENEGYAVTADYTRYGNSILLPENIYRVEARDASIKVDTYLERQRNDVLTDVKNKLVTTMHYFFNDAFTGSYVTAPDGNSLCNAAHAWNTSGSSTWDNYATKALDSDAVDDMEEYGGAFTDASGKPMPITFDTIVVKKGSDAARAARRLFAEGITPTAIADINIYEGAYTIIETPYITSTNKNYWFGLSSFLDNPLHVKINEIPTMREPQILENEAIRSNVTGFWEVFVANMPFAVYGSDGTT